MAGFNPYDERVPGSDTPWQYDDVDPDDDQYHVHDGDDGSTLVHYDHGTPLDHDHHITYYDHHYKHDYPVDYGIAYRATEDRD
jgi:hypothetical protein